MRVIGLLVRILAVIFAGLIGLLIFVVLIFSWSRANIETADAECNARRIEMRVESKSTEAYHDYCMRSKGYRKMSSCITLFDDAYAPVPSCYRPPWVFWID